MLLYSVCVECDKGKYIVGDAVCRCMCPYYVATLEDRVSAFKLYAAALDLCLLCTGFLQLWQVGTTLCCSAQTSHCSGLSGYGAEALRARASGVAARRLDSYCSWL